MDGWVLVDYLAPHKQAKNDQMRTHQVPDTGHMSSEIIVTADR